MRTVYHRPRPGRSPAVRPGLVALLVPLLALAGCDLITGGDDEPSVEGTWVQVRDTDSIYLEITSSTLTVYDGVYGDECYQIVTFAILDHDGDTYTLQRAGTSSTLLLTMTVVDGQLQINEATSSTQPQVYDPSDQDVSQLPECVGGGADPTIDCSTLPAITVGAAIDGALTPEDDAYAGSYYDLYGLTLDATTQVQIDMMSDSIDTYLLLYESDGTYVDENDDGGAGFNSRLTASLGAGCYRIEATSYDAGETGPYSLTVD